MKYALVVIKQPTAYAGTEVQLWQQFREEVRYTEVQILQNQGMPKDHSCKISESAWLVALDSNTHVLAAVVASAQRFHQDCTVLYFAEEPTVFLGKISNAYKG